MEQLLQRLLERGDLNSARMAAGAVRNKYIADPDGTMAALAAWTALPIRKRL